MPRQALRGLIRHRNFNEYYICATCGNPRRQKTCLSKPCKQCRSTRPPRIRITVRRGVGDLHHQDSKVSKKLFKAANVVREGLGFGSNRFPPAFPTREVLDSITEHPKNKRSKHWFCQVFLREHTYKGFLTKEICFTDVIEEVTEAMLSEKKMMQIRISADLHKWLKLYAAKNDTTMTTIIIEYLEYIRRRSEKAVKVEQI